MTPSAAERISIIPFCGAMEIFWRPVYVESALSRVRCLLFHVGLEQSLVGLSKINPLWERSQILQPMPRNVAAMGGEHNGFLDKLAPAGPLTYKETRNFVG